MPPESDESQFPSLYTHTLRKDWGVGVFAGEKDGKRRYLFANGEERTLASGFDQMMKRVERPSPEEQVAFARLQGILAGRGDENASAKRPGFTISNQLAKFREAYPGGVSDPDWIAEIRGSEGSRAEGSRQAMLREAQEKLDAKSLDALLGAQAYGELWDRVTALVARGNLVPSVQLKAKPSGEPLKALAQSVRELLHGTQAYDKRFDRYLKALAAAFGTEPHWELATALPALYFPLEQVCVEPSMFKKQLKLSGARGSATTRPTSAGYASFLSLARLIANKLAEQGEVPRDLWDVRGFIVFTLKPVPKTKPPKKATAKHDAPSEELD
jgi:hypothetical protein